MEPPYFRLIDERPDDWTFAADPATGGPWAPELQHGGPPNALLVHVAEQYARRHTGREDLVALRTAAEFVRPVPVAELSVTARLLRAARTAVLVEASLAAGGERCLSARIWLVRSAPETPPQQRAVVVTPQPSPDPQTYPPMAAPFPYGRSIDWHSVHGGLQEPGPAIVWARSRRPIVAGATMSGLQLAALVGDSASGVSAVLDWSQWSFLNVDLDVHLARELHGQWLCMDAVTTLGPAGSAMARSTLSDAAGLLGATGQTL